MRHSETWAGPDFSVLGAAKSGTTAIWTWLSQHPDVYLPEVKEPGYFAYAEQSARPENGPYDPDYTSQITTSWDQYAGLYAPAGTRLTGDVSPVYLTSRAAITRLQQRRPDARLIIALREPVSRAFSQYLHHRRDGLEPQRCFDLALNAEAERQQQGWSWSYAYRGNGEYQAQIAHVLSVFARTQILFLDYADLRADPAQCWQQICAHLQLTATDLVANPAVNTTHDLTHVPAWQGLTRSIRHPGAVQRMLKPLIPGALRRKLRGVIEAAQAPRPTLDPGTAARLRQSYNPELDWLRATTGLALRDWDSHLATGS